MDSLSLWEHVAYVFLFACGAVIGWGCGWVANEYRDVPEDEL